MHFQCFLAGPAPELFLLGPLTAGLASSTAQPSGVWLIQGDLGFLRPGHTQVRRPAASRLFSFTSPC